VKTIPLSTDANWTQVTTLGGRDFIFTFRWNAREMSWYLDIADQDNVLLAASRKLVADYPVLTRRTDPRLPRGVLWTIDRSGQGLDPGRYDLDERVILVFVEPGDL